MEKSQKRLILFMPSMDGGGVEKNIIIVANYLSKFIKKIVLITFDSKFNKKFFKKIKIINYKKNNNKRHSKYFKYFACMLILIKEITKNKHSSVFAFQANIYSSILSKIFNFKLIVRSNSSPSGWTKSFLKNYIFKKFFQYPVSIVVNSKKFKQQIDRKFNVKSNLIYNPLNKSEILAKSKQSIDLKIFKNKKSLKLINIARFTDQKDHLTLLKAFKKVNKKINCELLIIGYGPNEFQIKNYIKDNKLGNKIKILKYQENPFKFIKMSDVCVLTSKYEGLPNVLLESLTLKKFIISTNCPTGPSEILNNGKYGFLFEIGDYNNLANLILKYYNNKKKFKNKILSGYKSLNRYNLKNNCKKYYMEVKKVI